MAKKIYMGIVNKGSSYKGQVHANTPRDVINLLEAKKLRFRKNVELSIIEGEETLDGIFSCTLTDLSNKNKCLTFLWGNRDLFKHDDFQKCLENRILLGGS